MAYEFKTDNNTHLKTFHNINQVAEYLKNKEGFNARGFSLRTLRALEFEEGGTYAKNGYKLTKLAGTENYINRGVNKEFKRLKTATTTHNEVKYTTGQRKRKNDEININLLNINNFLLYIEDIVQTIPNKKKLFISFVITFTNAEGQERHVSTKYANYNNYLNVMKLKLSRLLENYGEELIFNTYTLKYYEGIEDNNIIVFKQLNTKKQTNKHTIINEFNENKDISQNEFYKDIKKCLNVISPTTYKDCFIKCFIMFIENNENMPAYGKMDHRALRKLELSNTIKDTPQILKLLTRLTKKTYTATIYFYNGITINKHFYEIETNDEKAENINILIKGSHAHLMNFKKDFVLKNEEQHEEQNINCSMIEQKTTETKDKEYNIYTWDLETISDEQTGKTTPYALGIYTGASYYEFYKDTKEDDIFIKFVDFIDNIKQDTIFYAHNSGKFDSVILISVLLQKFKIDKFLDSNGRIINISFRNKKKFNISFRDSINFICFSLANACDAFKTKTKKLIDTVKHNLININNCFKGSTELIEGKTIYEYTSEYLKNDCISLRELMFIFNDIIKNAYGFNAWDVFTNAGIARRVFLDKYYKPETSQIYHLRRDIDAEIRAYYNGGRNEVFKTLGITKGPLYYVDFTSLYPYVMQKKYYPVGEMEIITPEDKHTYNYDWFGFVKVNFKHNENNTIKPYHPIKHNGKLIFANVAEFQTAIFTTEEIKYSLANNLNYTYEFIKVYHYKEKKHIFKDMIKDLFKMKSEAEEKGNEALRTISKIIINSSYGFWGINYYSRNQNIIKSNEVNNTKGKSEEYIKEKIDKLKNNVLMGYLTEGKLINHIDMGKHSLYQIEDEIEPGAANVGLAFFVAAYGRTELYDLMRDIEKNKGNILYCDTDSVICDLNIYEVKEIKNKFIRSNNKLIGELTNEASPYYEKLLKKAGYDKKEINKFITKHTPHFTELITIANKFYYLGLKFEYKGIEYKAEIKKGKGINLKNKYLNKSIDKENKIITFDNIDNEGHNEMTRKEYKYLIKGYKLNFETLQFKAGFKASIMENKGLIKLNVKKNIIKIYDKAILNNGIISTMTI